MYVLLLIIKLDNNVQKLILYKKKKY